jgi:hypothetical protein
VLLAEDEQFQRLALLDILTLCDYEGKTDRLLFKNNKSKMSLSVSQLISI